MTPVPPKNSGGVPLVALRPKGSPGLILMLIWGQGCILLARAGLETRSEQISFHFIDLIPLPFPRSCSGLRTTRSSRTMWQPELPAGWCPQGQFISP